MRHVYLGEKGDGLILASWPSFSVMWQVTLAKRHLLPHASASLTTIIRAITVSNFPPVLRNLLIYAH